MSEYSPTLVCANEVDGLTTTQVHRNEPSTRNLPSKEVNQPPNQGVTGKCRYGQTCIIFGTKKRWSFKTGDLLKGVQFI